MKNKYEWLTKELLEEDYKNLGSFKLIAEKYNLAESTIQRYCKVIHKINYVPKINYNCNDKLFSKDAEESFYVAGFIAADGSINKNKSKEPNYFTICLSSKDEDHLLKLKNIMKFTGPIKTNINKLSKYNKKWNDASQCKIDIYSKRMINDLKRFGIGQCKSLTYDMPDWLIAHPLVNHFIRGYVDGDGSFYINKEKRKTKNDIAIYKKFVFSLRGTDSFLQNFDKIVKNGSDLGSIAKPKFNGGIYQLAYSGNGQVKIVSKFLYKNANIFLDRKFDIVKELL